MKKINSKKKTPGRAPQKLKEFLQKAKTLTLDIGSFEKQSCRLFYAAVTSLLLTTPTQATEITLSSPSLSSEIFMASFENSQKAQTTTGLPVVVLNGITSENSLKKIIEKTTSPQSKLRDPEIQKEAFEKIQKKQSIMISENTNTPYCFLYADLSKSKEDILSTMTHLDKSLFEAVPGDKTQWHSLVLAHEIYGHCQDTVNKTYTPELLSEIRADQAALAFYDRYIDDPNKKQTFNAYLHARNIGSLNAILLEGTPESLTHSVGLSLKYPDLSYQYTSLVYTSVANTLLETLNGTLSLESLYGAAKTALKTQNYKNAHEQDVLLSYTEGLKFFIPSLEKTYEKSRTSSVYR